MAQFDEAIQQTQEVAEVHAPDAAHAGGHPPELPNFIHVLDVYFPDNPIVDFLVTYQNQIFILILIGIIAFIFNMATRHRALIPSRLQAGVELVIEGLLALVTGMLGEKEGRRYFPFLGSLFIFILFMNWFGLIPLMKAPTSAIQVTGGLAICVFMYVQFVAIGRLGIRKYFYHLMGEPKDAIGWVMVPLFLPLHIMEEFIKPLSLACRLFGNVYGEDILLGVGMVLGVGMMLAIWDGAFFGIPLHFPFMLLALLLSTIQALVFTLLATVYISMVLPHEEHQLEMTLPHGESQGDPHH
ncbi:MAG: F0F1 ATP synthase subunit A [bacterium]|jgi:F-type H+-transporting ATPase subunit a